MINVNETTKQAWLSDRKVNSVVITFPNLDLTFGIDDIDKDNFSLKESLCNADSMEFVGCIASSLKVAIYNIADNVKGEEIAVTIKAGDTESIPLFKGFVDSVEIDADSRFKTIIAYDPLYNAGQVDVASWYARLPLPMTLGEIRESLMTYVGLTEVEGTELPNDDVTIYRTLENPDTIQALTVIKSICQLNGACGIINRSGEFEYRYIQTSMQTSYSLPFFESLKYEEYFCNAIQRVQIRDTEDDAGVNTSNYGNKYIIQANMFAFELATDVLYSMANNILEKINGFTYHPMRSLQNGLPFVEVGDTIEYTVSSAGYGIDTFLILSRTLTGIQFCRDSFESRGTQNQSEYISDIQAEVEVLKRTTTEIRNLSTKIVDYILPTNIEESDIASGGNSNVIEFEFYNSAENETTSLYASVNFDIATDADLQTETYGDCTLTVTYIKDGTAVEVQQHTFGDGSLMLMLNYLLQGLSKGNHTFKIKFSLSGGALSSLQVISAYILAASVVEEGNFEEEYDIDTNPEFEEYMMEEGQEVVGEDIIVDVPTGGTEPNNFNGTKFCTDWLSAFTMPIEYVKIFDEVGGYTEEYPDTGNEADWSGFKVPFEWQTEQITEQPIQSWLDNDVYTNTGHHINLWFASIAVRDAGTMPPEYEGYYSYAIGGVYLPPTTTFRCTGNYPTQGYATFEISESVYLSTYTATSKYTHVTNQGNAIGRRYKENEWDDVTGGVGEVNSFVIVYNPNVFKSYLRRQSEATIKQILNSSYFALAECNISKSKG